MTDENTKPKTAGTGDATGTYTPVFPDKVRTGIYIATLFASVAGLGFLTFGYPDVGGFIGTAAGIIAAGFGVAYNPVRLANK